MGDWANRHYMFADSDIGYLLAPEQKKVRRRGKLKLKSIGIRCVAPKINAKTFRENGEFLILGGFGSKTARGGQTKKATLSSLLEQNLNSDAAVEVLNASANSWGPRNELAYLQRFGLFDSQTLALVINTDDLFATEPSSLVVGSPSYPERAPALALTEYYRLIAPPQEIPELTKLRQSDPAERSAQNLNAIAEIKAIAEASQTEFVLVLTPLLRELQEGSQPAELSARKRLQELVTQENIEYLDFLTVWKDFPQPEFLYRDRIHPSPQGYSRLVEEIGDRIRTK